MIKIKKIDMGGTCGTYGGEEYTVMLAAQDLCIICMQVVWLMLQHYLWGVGSDQFSPVHLQDSQCAV